MARKLYAIEKGIRVFAENSDTVFIDYISGGGAPAGVSGETDDAPIGSQYNDLTNGIIYIKKTNTSAAIDWEEVGGVSIDELAWRNEKVLFATGATIAAGVVDVDAIADNDGGLVHGDVAVNDVLIGDVDGSPALFKVDSLGTSPNITVSAYVPALADNNTFIVQKYLPDAPSNQEKQAIIHFPLASGAGLKIADINWNLADGITLNGYSDTVGAVLGSDTVQVAIQKIEKGLKDALTVLGVSRNDTDLGAFSANGSFLLGATETVKSALQKISDYIFGIKVTQTPAVQASTVVDSLPHASFKYAKFIVEVFETATPANRESFTIDALSDGTTSDDNGKSGRLRIGSNLGVAVVIAINGANMELSISSTPVCTVNVRRITVI